MKWTALLAALVAACTHPRNDNIDQLANRMFTVHRFYLDRLATIDWSDCGRARADLAASEPTAQHYKTEMRTIEAALPDADHRQRFAELTKTDPRAKDINDRLAHMFERYQQADDRCRDTPGWRDAVDVAITAPLGTP